MPDYIFQDDRLTPTAIKVYCFINSYTGRQFFFGNEHLAQMFNCSESAITRGITQLKEFGYIDTQTDGRRRYVINLRVGENAESESAKMTTPFELDGSAKTPSHNELPTALPKENNIKENNLSKNFEKEEIPNNLDNLLPSQRKAIKKKPFGFIPVKGNPKQYVPEFNQRRKGGINALDVV